MVKASCARLSTFYVDRHAQAMAAVKANVSWLSQFYVESHTHSEQQHQCITVLNTILNTSLPLLAKSVSKYTLQEYCCINYSYIYNYSVIS